jgi:hypothetical protein
MSEAWYANPKHAENLKKMQEGNKGKHPSEKTLAALLASVTGRKASEETRLKMSLKRKGVKKSDVTRENMSKGWEKRAPATEETRAKQGASHKGDKCFFFNRKKPQEEIEGVRRYQTGRNKTEIAKAKMCEKKIGGFWYGNVRYDERKYCELFDGKFKERVRSFWGYACFECGTPQNGKKLSVHHVHYDKKMCCNGSPKDVVPLCSSCHSATLTNRDYWEEHFTKLLYAYNIDGKCYFTKLEMEQYTNHKI